MVAKVACHALVVATQWALVAMAVLWAPVVAACRAMAVAVDVAGTAWDTVD